MAKILVVDDNYEVVEVLVMMLEQDHEVVGLADPVQALERLKAEPFELLMTDIRMPHKDGFVLIGDARKVRPDMKFILFSADYDYKDATERTITANFAPVTLAKPFTGPAVRAAVESVLA